LTVVQRYVHQTGSASLLEEIRSHASALPPRERDRLHRASVMEGSRLDTTHPPTALRIEFLKAHPVKANRALLSDVEFEAIDCELQRLEGRVQRELVDAYRRSLYR
jgi:hypothetical protein